jgi:P2 phage tail completion protein R (GpR)
MQKITDLHTFIANLNLVAAEQIDSAVDDLSIIPSGRPAAVAGQLVIAEKHYTASFFIERYPHGKVSEDQLLAQISAWLLANDTGRLEPVGFDMIIDVLDAQTANLEFGIPFTELITCTPYATGAIVVNGVKYKL